MTIPNSLAGKVAIVTGASRGIGRAVAERLAQAGCRLVLNHRSDEAAMAQTVRACQLAGAKLVIHRGDVGDRNNAVTIGDLAVEHFGKIDILVNNAGVCSAGLLATLNDQQVERMLLTNTQGVVWMSRAVMRAMITQRGGCIINLSSVLASKPGRGNAVYAGTKGFVESFSRALAAEVGRKNIRVNALAPGVIDTDMSKSIRDLAGEQVTQQVALKRLGSPKEVASVVSFLASDEAAYISGAVIAVDGAFMGGM